MIQSMMPPIKQHIPSEDDLMSSGDDDSHSMNSDFSETTRGTNRTAAQSEAEEVIADSLSQVVKRWRACVVIMLLITAGLVVTTTYLFLRDNEDAQFQKSFEKSASSIKDSVEFHATNAVHTFEALADGMTGEAVTANATWPFFTSKGFEVAAAHARLNAFAETVMLMPLVLGRQREEWEAYSVTNAGWLDESKKLAAETNKWLEESDFFHPPGTTDPPDDGVGELKRETPSGRLLRTQRNAITIDILQEDPVEARKTSNFTEKGEETTANATNNDQATSVPTSTGITTPPTTTTTTTTTTISTSTSSPPSAATNIPEIPKEIFLKGEDLPGGVDGDTTIVSESWRIHYAPVWQISPPPRKPSLINYNFLGDATSGGTFNAIRVSGNKAIVSELLKTSTIDFFYEDLWTTEEHWGFHSSSGVVSGEARTPGTFPHSTTIAPIRASFDPNAEIVGLIAGIAPWDLYLSRLLPEGTNGVYAVLSNSCAQVVTYIINGPEAIYLGTGDLHDTKYDSVKETLSFTGFGISSAASRNAGQCDYFLALYASDEYRSDYDDKRAEFFTIVLAAVFLATGMVFFVFAMYVQRRQQEVMTTALKTNQIVASLFPANVRERILRDAEEQIEQQQNPNGLSSQSSHALDASTQNLKRYLREEKEEAERRSMVESTESEEINTNIFGSAPIADLFPETTLMFADLVGFTAWSSMREPTQVFTLLETVYHSFDQLANKRRVFKVETVGDCYVAVTGVPEPRKDHAVVMCRFAKDCFDKLKPLLKRLEVVLGPDTGDLSMRFGLHSGPVTAGVLRGERARFQLFGDTMNTCSRIETTGKTGHIHISQQTADLLKAAGKESWYVPRKDKVVAKGKGELQTYWLVFKQNDGVSTCSGGSGSKTSFVEFGEGSSRTVGEQEEPREAAPETKAAWPSSTSAVPPQLAGIPSKQKQIVLSKKAERLVDWNVDILSRLLRQIVARRESDGGKTLSGEKLGPIEHEMRSHQGEGTVLDEVKEIIQLPKYDSAAARRRKEQISPQSIKLHGEVTAQLRTYVSTVASMYRDTVPFHNFEHASHVTMSVVKLLSRIVAPKLTEVEGDFNKELHDHTYGIASDPLTQFAVVLSALMHDVDHVGVPNAQLVKENSAICSLYRNKSVAEQNSVDLSWNLLMEERFDDLRATIYSSKGELTRFRQLVVNTVLATDIVDKELKELRNARWDRAFHHTLQPEDEDVKEHSLFNDDATNRKATIVIEHIIQASDIAHTMQHWHIYRKWNERFFEENMVAYQTGRAAKDPCDFWYKGEIGFFDFYIIPLAKKLEECGVFGVSSHEYRQYALANREEWVTKGEQIVAEMKAKYGNNAEESDRDGAQPDERRSSMKSSLPLKRASTRSRETFQNEPRDMGMRVPKRASAGSREMFHNEGDDEK